MNSSASNYKQQKQKQQKQQQTQQQRMKNPRAVKIARREAIRKLRRKTLT